MDLSDPTRAVTPTLDGPVLAVLAAAGRALTVGEVSAQATRGSEIGIRRSISRLVEQGLVRATLVGRNTVHELNRDHLAAGVAEGLAGLRLEFWRRLRSALSEWDIRPVYACVFGSAARGDGDERSDIDLLLVHPPLQGEKQTRRPAAAGLADLLASIAMTMAAPGLPADPDRWHEQVDRLRGLVQAWTGNPLQVVDISAADWWTPGSRYRALLADVRRDGVEVARSAKYPHAFAAGRSVG